jgi:hypothetical protein
VLALLAGAHEQVRPLVAPVRGVGQRHIGESVGSQASHQFSPSQADCAPAAGMLPASKTMKPDWLMDQFSALVPNGTPGSGIHFQHPDQPLSATTLPQPHPLKTRIATLHYRRCVLCATGKSIRSTVAFATSRSIFSYLGIWTAVRP